MLYREAGRGGTSVACSVFQNKRIINRGQDIRYNSSEVFRSAIKHRLRVVLVIVRPKIYGRRVVAALKAGRQPEHHMRFVFL
jgi:hypothetical protein